MNYFEGTIKMKSRKPAGQSPVAVEIDHLAEDLLDAADAIERLTKKYSDDVQKILKAQADQIKALAADQGLELKAEGDLFSED